MKQATNGNVRLAYEVDGPPDGEPVVFIEGLGYGRWMWRWQQEPLAADYRTVLWDNRGTGESDAPDGPYSIETMAADLEAVLEDAGIDRAHVVGASMGGMIAQRYALEYDRAATLSLLCTTPGGPDAVPVPDATQEQMFAAPPDADERERIKHRMRPAVSDTFYENEPELIERIVDWRLEGDASDAAKGAQAAGVAAFDAADELSNLETPTLIMHGDDDRVLPVENAHLLAELLPNARLEVVEGGPHLFFIESADWVTDQLEAFFEANPIETGGA
ncbi:alpha/beta hydrolase [Halobacteria archaeon AArc-curdl1]|uniref:Alpha/beta hydrolase n=1 Tax=Natronosalvus hydrolyticus TaxID=2979988 RepID=A0AAP2Z9L0_9EURY|nr:alpha/beta hydrolase [Halobacteria archaeon AArc-curdl1]